MALIERWCTGMGRILLDVSSILLFLIMVTVFLQVVFRYVLMLSVPWTEEAARYLNVWMVFLGCAVAVEKSKHIRVTFIIDQMKGWAHEMVALAILALMLAFDVVVVLGAYRLTRMNWNQQAPTLPVTVSALYMALIVASFFAALFLLHQIGRKLSALAGGDA